MRAGVTKIATVNIEMDNREWDADREEWTGEIIVEVKVHGHEARHVLDGTHTNPSIENVLHAVARLVADYEQEQRVVLQ